MALVTSISSMFKDDSENPQNKRKAIMLRVLDKTLQQYYNKLSQGKIQINSTIDLERIIRSSILLMGDQLSDTSQDTTATGTQTAEIPDNDPDIQALYQKLYSKYNKVNDSD